METRRTISMGFSNRAFTEGCHIIYVYTDDEERKATMAKYLRQGLQDNEKVLYLVHDISPEEMMRELEQRGLGPATKRNGFDLTTNHPSCCPGGHFSPEYMLGVVGEFYQSALAEGFDGARGAGEMAWAAQTGQVDLQDLIDYEGRLNEILAEHPLTTVCQYDAKLFGGDVIMKLLAAHPYMIVRGQLVENPHFAPPNERTSPRTH